VNPGACQAREERRHRARLRELERQRQQEELAHATAAIEHQRQTRLAQQRAQAEGQAAAVASARAAAAATNAGADRQAAEIVRGTVAATEVQRFTGGGPDEDGLVGELVSWRASTKPTRPAARTIQTEAPMQVAQQAAVWPDDDLLRAPRQLKEDSLPDSLASSRQGSGGGAEPRRLAIVDSDGRDTEEEEEEEVGGGLIGAGRAVTESSAATHEESIWRVDLIQSQPPGVSEGLMRVTEARRVEVGEAEAEASQPATAAAMDDAMWRIETVVQSQPPPGRGAAAGDATGVHHQHYHPAADAEALWRVETVRSQPQTGAAMEMLVEGEMRQRAEDGERTLLPPFGRGLGVISPLSRTMSRHVLRFGMHRGHRGGGGSFSLAQHTFALTVTLTVSQARKTRRTCFSPPPEGGGARRWRRRRR
jgi:hypothetical protein